MLYGSLFKALRKRTGFTSQEIADYLHVSRSTYSRYENNLKNVEDDILADIAKFYDTTIDDLNEWNGYMRAPDYPYNIYPLLKRRNSAK